MSAQPPPIQNLPIFNKSEFNQASTNVTYSNGDGRYLKLTGGSESGPIGFSTSNTSAVGSENQWIGLNSNPIYIRGDNTARDTGSYLGYANVVGNSYQSLNLDGPCLVGQFGVVLGTNSSWNMRCDSKSNGTTTNGPLTVGGVINANGLSTKIYTSGYLTSAGTTGTKSDTGDYSILSANRIKATEFNAVSSRQIKKIIASVDDPGIKQELISLFKSIPLSKYKYIDPQKHDSYDHYGLIAEDMPHNSFGVGIWTDSSQSEYAPNIFSEAIVESIELDSKGVVVIVTLSQPERLLVSQISNHDNILGYLYDEKLQAFAMTQEFSNLLILSTTQISLRTTSKELNLKLGDLVLIYGSKEIIPNISKNNYMELVACVVKDLLKRIENLESTI